jgi:hypothetical protein
MAEAHPLQEGCQKKFVTTEISLFKIAAIDHDIDRFTMFIIMHREV